jgi:MFS family permease
MSLVCRTRQRFYGWWIVSVTAVLYGYGAGVNFYGFGVFFNPMREEFGWSRAATAGVFSLARLEGAPLGPIIGWLIDRIGSRRMMVAGLSLTGLGFISMYFIQSLWMFYVIYGLFIATGFSMGFFQASQAVVANWFFRRRSQALSYLAVGGGLGGAALVPAMGAFMGMAGWRWTAVAVGLLMWVVGIPLALLLRNRPEDVGQVPDGLPSRHEARAAHDATRSPSTPVERVDAAERREVEFTVGQALRTSTFWTLVLAMAFRSSILSSIVVHQIAHLEDIGVTRHTAEAMLGLMIAMSIPGRLLFGWLGDRISKQHLLAFSSVLQGIGIFIIANATGLVYVWPFLLFYGLGYGGAIPLTQALRADLFGRRVFATIGGLIMPFTTLGGVAGPIFAGYVYDVTDSYRIAFYTFVVLILLSGLTFLFVRPPKQAVPVTSPVGCGGGRRKPPQLGR